MDPTNGVLQAFSNFQVNPEDLFLYQPRMQLTNSAIMPPKKPASEVTGKRSNDNSHFVFSLFKCHGIQNDNILTSFPAYKASATLI
jgi:hypothetical protein